MFDETFVAFFCPKKEKKKFFGTIFARVCARVYIYALYAFGEYRSPRRVEMPLPYTKTNTLQLTCKSHIQFCCTCTMTKKGLFYSVISNSSYSNSNSIQFKDVGLNFVRQLDLH